MQTAGEGARGRLGGKRALLTGAASGIGRATAELFAREGAAIVLFDRDAAGGRAVAEQATAEGGRAFFVEGDVTRTADCERVVSETLRLLGGLDVLFNNAGIIHRGSILETSEDEFDRTLAVNVKGIFLLSRCAIPGMTRPGGVIVNTASNWGLVGGARAAAYCASKGAVVLLTKAMALDHGRRGFA